MDNAFPAGKFPGYTIDQLRKMQLNHGVLTEIERREAVAAGDESQMTPGERLRFVKADRERAEADMAARNAGAKGIR